MAASGARSKSGRDDRDRRTETQMGPLDGIRIVEIAGLAPGPFCAMMLADNGAEVLKIDRAAGQGDVLPVPTKADILGRGRRSVAVDLKHPDGVATVLRLVDRADGLIEGFRPGVMERLGLGPDACLERNPRLVYGRMTGWGQDGPLVHAAGHDINYIALSGALDAIGRTGDAPVPPLNLVGDFGGGGMLLAFGMVAALLSAARTGQGQVVDAAMVDGAAALMAMTYGLKAAGFWPAERGGNLLDTGAHFYEVYETKDGKFVALGSIEPQFYAELLKKTGLDSDPDFAQQMNPAAWPALKERLAEVMRTKTRAEWCDLMEGSDVCFAPVLSMAEAPEHPHNRARGSFFENDGVVQPAPAPRFSETAAETPSPPAAPGADTDAALADWGFTDSEIAALRQAGAVS